MRSLKSSSALETIYARILRLGLRQFSICSIHHQAGNSTIAYSLAQRAAESGKRVLLLELNRRSPILAQYLGMSANEWLPLTGNWEHAAQESENPGLMVLNCPEKSSHCVEFRDQETLKLFFSNCLERFDLVICDTEPLLLSAQATDKACFDQEMDDSLPVDVICAASEATLLNIETGKTTESQVDEARDILFQSGASLKGVIMNDRYAPGLKQELIRETYRLQRFMPTLMRHLRFRLEKMVLLNQEL